ncbi:peptide chain release factor N(5)-glutamine methyltransferase [Kineobactrum salinum]|uniref:Release factor glutamine methyltransferase n=1 Tax=Kineobactrum salinum TaxID=2708301 RepID=A0A6C0U3Q6_9GAMM|nr:peptide chain release factor N(5)-glutamine methyltransferase [Kineobactrum salinum]QIB66568.1 peptide chain release factor N(5)-glutamine methyltransferase [Kineobactrum salinum]
MAQVRQLLAAGADLPGESPRRDAEVLLGHVLGKSRAWLYTWPEQTVAAPLAAAFGELLTRRRSGVPVAYLTGRREFWSLSLQVSEATLIPRPETETLVEWALQLPLPAEAAVLDLGTGSGALAIALACERKAWRITAVDVSEAALAVAAFNVSRLCPGRVSLHHSDWFAAVAQRNFDLIVSNPPYVESDSEYLRRGDVAFEPRSALVAGSTGLDDIRQLVDRAPHFLRDGGWLLLEHGHRQAGAVRELMQEAGFPSPQTRCDLAGHERVTGASTPSKSS